MSQKGIKVLMAEKRIFPPSKEFSKRAHIKSLEEYEKLYKRSVEDPEASGLKWQKKTSPGLKKWDKVSERLDFKRAYTDSEVIRVVREL